MEAAATGASGRPASGVLHAFFVDVVSLGVGIVCVVRGDSVLAKAVGVGAILCSVALAWIAILHLRKPIKR